MSDTVATHILNSASDAAVWSASRLGCFTHVKRVN